MAVNKIFQDLLSLQQDGALAAIGPNNWSEEAYPGLINTKQVLQIREIANQLKANTTSGVWHFLVGSPGNGKSALTGELRRILLDDDWRTLPPKFKDHSLPYTSSLSREHEEFQRLVIVQDASVSESPHDPTISLAEQLVNVIEEAYQKGSSLIVCANRGVLEQLPTIENITEKKWFKQVKNVINRDEDYSGEVTFSDKANQVYRNAKLTSVQLDHLRLSQGEDSALEDLLNTLVTDERWDACAGCSYNNLCPFRLNQILLLKKQWQERLINVLEMLELYRGQPLVFREVGALLSIILSGPSSDYDEDLNPCKWVQGKVETNDFQSLLSRRVYMVLFSGVSICGFDVDKVIYKNQTNQIKNIINKIDDKKTIWSSLGSSGLSAISGCEDARQTLAELDPLVEVHRDDDLSCCLFDTEEVREYLEEIPELWTLERGALDEWNRLSNLIQKHQELSNDGSYGLLHRLSSSFLVRLMGFVNHFNIHLRFEEEIAEFMRLIESVNSNWDESKEVEDEIGKHRNEIRDAIGRISGSSLNRTSLSENLEASNQFLGKVASMNIRQKSDPLWLHVILEFGKKQKVTSQLNGELFCWIRRTLPKEHLTLFPLFIPKKLVAGIRVARRQAISLGQYLESDDAELFTRTFKSNETVEYRMVRSDVTGRPSVRPVEQDG